MAIFNSYVDITRWYVHQLNAIERPGASNHIFHAQVASLEMDLSEVLLRRWARKFRDFFGGFWRFPGTVDSHGFQRRNPEKSPENPENMGDSNHVFCSIDSFFRETLKETLKETMGFQHENMGGVRENMAFLKRCPILVPLIALHENEQLTRFIYWTRMYSFDEFKST